MTGLGKNYLKLKTKTTLLNIKKRNKVNNMKKIAKEEYENNLDNFLLNNSSNPKNVLENNEEVNQI